MRSWLRVMLTLLFLSLSGFSRGADSLLGTAGKLLQIGVSSRAIAMGEAYTAVADNVDALYWNPAGLADVSQLELTYMHNLWLLDMQNAYLAYAQPLIGGGLGLGINYFNFGEFQTYDIDSNHYPVPLNKVITPYSVVISAGYGMNLSRLGSLGGTLKLLSENVDNFSSMSMVLDLGVQLKDLFVTGLKGGVMIQNLGTSIENYSLPFNVRLGLSYPLPYLIDAEHDAFTIACDGRLPLPLDESYSVNMGLEYNYHNVVFGRAGYKFSQINQLGGAAGLSAGVGVRLFNFALDYALSPMGALGLVHRVTLSAQFEVTKAATSPETPRYKKTKLVQHRQAVGLGSSQTTDLNDMMTSLTRLSMRNPISVVVDAQVDPKDQSKIKKAVFEIHMNISKAVRRWGLKILNANGDLLQGFSGEGQPPKLTWDGKNRDGQIVPESIFATYTLEMLLQDGSVENLKGKLMGNHQEPQAAEPDRKTLEPIYFEENSADLTPEAIERLKKAAEEIKSRPYVKILISGHADAAGEKDSSFLLSKTRIDRVVRYLTAIYKIPLSSIATRAFGFKKPASSNQTEAGQEKNRRVEITIVYKK